MLHPRVRLPLLAAVAIVAAAFGLRTLLHGWSFDAQDALVLGLFVVVLAATALVRFWVANRGDGSDRDDHAAEDSDETARRRSV